MYDTNGNNEIDYDDDITEGHLNVLMMNVISTVMMLLTLVNTTIVFSLTKTHGD